MGSSFQEYQHAQKEAKAYALSQRKIHRNTFRYVVFSALSLSLTFLIAPKWVLPSLLISVGCYGLARFGITVYTKGKHWWLDRQAKNAARREGISQEPLLSHSTRFGLREKANGPLTQALQTKNLKIAHYAKNASFHDSEPLSYTDRKHKHALFQYRMLEHAKEAALNGDENFIENLSADHSTRKQKKIEILEKIRTYMNEGTISLVLKHIDKSPDCECIVTGHSAAMLLREIQNWNTFDPLNCFLPVPAGLTPIQSRQFIKNSLLPLLLDMDTVIGTIKNPSVGAPLARQGNNFLVVKSYAITAEYLSNRIAGLKKPEPSWKVSGAVV